MPVVVVVASRPGEPSANDKLLRELRTHPVTRTIHPAALSRAGVEALVWRRLSEPESGFVDACMAVTEGNPYLLCELLTDLENRGVAPTDSNAGAVGALAPEAVLDAALVRLARLPSGSAALARGTAVL